MSGINVGRFASPFRTETYVFPGECQCPGSPHDQDTAEVLVRISASAKARIGRAEIEGAVSLDPLRAHRQVVLEGVVRWSLRWPDPEAPDQTVASAGIPVPVNAASVELLDDLVPLAEWIDRLWDSGDPNSAAPSRKSRRGSKSQVQMMTPARGT